MRNKCDRDGKYVGPIYTIMSERDYICGECGCLLWGDSEMTEHPWGSQEGSWYHPTVFESKVVDEVGCSHAKAKNQCISRNLYGTPSCDICEVEFRCLRKNKPSQNITIRLDEKSIENLEKLQELFGVSSKLGAVKFCIRFLAERLGRYVKDGTIEVLDEKGDKVVLILDL